jgi:hypothetical protein
MNLVRKLGSVKLKVTRLTDQGKDGGRLLLSKVDPFAFFGAFNRGIKDEQCLAILAAIKHLFGIESPVSTRSFKNMEQKAASIIGSGTKRSSN